MKTAIIILSMLSALMVLLARQFNRYLYIPFMRKMNLEPMSRSEFNPHLLPLGLCVAGCGMMVYAVIGWFWMSVL